MDDEKHYPGQEDAPKDPTVPQEPEAEKPEEPKEPEPEADKPEDKPDIKSKRSIYDDYKEKKQELKAAEERAAAAEAKAAELESLLQKQEEAETPAERKQAAKDLKEYASKYNYDAGSLEELRSIFAKDILSDEDKALLAEYKADKAARAKEAEDKAILDLAPTVKEQLSIHNDDELKVVMSEIVKLAHTDQFHDKEVEYIVWKNKDALSKLVSPKRNSFETGDNRQPSQGKGEIDYSKGGLTPELLSREMTSKGSTYTISRSK